MVLFYRILSHTFGNDEVSEAKYGPAWNIYRQRIKYRLIPYVFWAGGGVFARSVQVVAQLSTQTDTAQRVTVTKSSQPHLVLVLCYYARTSTRS